MKQPAEYSKVKSAARLFVLTATLLEQLLRFGFLRLRRGRALTLAERATWMSRGCSQILGRLGFVLEQKGAPSRGGLIVSNHLSHLDILFYSASAGCVFLSKSEVKRWPLFGLLARCGGTIFVERERACTAMRAADELKAALSADVPVLLFPEGTSSDGDGVLPFRSMLFEPAVASAAPITAAALAYAAEGVRERDLCYYGDVRFVPHLLRCVGLSNLQARIDWLGAPAVYDCRKRAARVTHAAVVAARERGYRVESPAPVNDGELLIHC